MHNQRNFTLILFHLFIFFLFYFFFNLPHPWPNMWSINIVSLMLHCLRNMCNNAAALVVLIIMIIIISMSLLTFLVFSSHSLSFV